MAVLAFSGLSKSFNKPDHQPESVNTPETTQLSNIEGFEFEVAEPRENSGTTLESEQPTQQITSVEEIQTEVTDNSSENRSVFYQWSESEVKLRETYTQVLNDSNSSSAELESRKTQYLLFVNNKNKKCGDLTPKISSNLNSDVSTLTFNDDEIPILKCHIEENKSQLSELSSVEN